MADEQNKCKLSCGFKFWVCALLCLLVVVLPRVSSQPVSKLFLNSDRHCREAGFVVDNSTVYNVLDGSGAREVSGKFQDCHMMFQSAYPDGRVCLKQHKLDFHFGCHVQLELYDGWMDPNVKKKANKVLENGRSSLPVEWCSSGRNLTIRIAQNGKNPSLEDTSIDILVYDMQSVHRTASLDYNPSCGSTFSMDSSHVVVTNIDPSGHVRKELFPKCSLTFEYKGQDKNRTMCMIFEAVQELNRGCSKLNYTLKVFSLDKELITTRSCNNPLPRRWCSKSTKITLELQRSDETGTEDAVLFYAMVVDHDGDLDTLPTLTVPQAQVQQASCNVGLAVGLSVAACLCLLVVCAVIFLKRRHLRFLQSSSNGGANAGHLPPSMKDRNSYQGDRTNASVGHNPLLSELSAGKHQNTTLTSACPPPTHPCPPPPCYARVRKQLTGALLPPLDKGQGDVQSA